MHYNNYTDLNNCFLFYSAGPVLYHGKETIYSETVNYLLTQVVQSDKYYKSLAVGFMFKVGLITDRRPSELSLSLLLFLLLSPSLRDMASFILP